jgi:hypothetical protein
MFNHALNNYDELLLLRLTLISREQVASIGKNTASRTEPMTQKLCLNK